MGMFIAAVAFIWTLNYVWECYKMGPSTLFQFFEECEDERRWISAQNELARVDPALALELEYDHKTAIRHYV